MIYTDMQNLKISQIRITCSSKSLGPATSQRKQQSLQRRNTADILTESQALAAPLHLRLSAPSAHVRDEEAAKPAALEPAPHAALPSLPHAANQLLITTVLFLTWLLPMPPLLSPSHTKFTLPDKSS